MYFDMCQPKGPHSSVSSKSWCFCKNIKVAKSVIINYAKNLRIFCIPVMCPEIGSFPIELGCVSPTVPLRKALLALAAAFRRGFGKDGGSFFWNKANCPEAKTGANLFNVFPLHAIGRDDNLADKTWLT